MEVDYNPPDISDLNLDDFPVFNMTTYHFPLNQADFLARVPWITLDDLPLPEGYRIVGFSEAFPSQYILNDDWLFTKYPRQPITYLYIWTSDGFAQCMIRISFVSNQKIRLSSDSAIEILQNTVGSTMVTIPGLPLTIEIADDSNATTPAQRIKMLQALTGIERISNPEKLELEYVPQGLLYIAFSYADVPKHTITKQEFEKQVPWIYIEPDILPQGFQIVEFAKVDLPEEYKSFVPIYVKYPRAPIRDYVIILSEGQRYHYIGISDGTEDGVIEGDFVVNYYSNAATIIIEGKPVAVYSHSSFLTSEEQLRILFGLFGVLEVSDFI